ncbi:hypothetical protein LAZ67_1006888 [Cordylochernes scorpioides]|uniref:DDE-1 domain-containing protein n=1 Tax=Cordylochernes scorpioides TaxID=51811 RepID=A0ABY6JZR6_9ARAC|nr:hypothetical protein LAZ67_1006888 [Cordylochernes scorpioides]
MPTRTYIAKSEKNASGFKAAKDRVTLLLCSNASGDRMLKPLLVNRSLKPRALKGKDLNTLPVHWMANKKAWVTTAIFTEWFNKCFVPEVENYMKEMGLEFKILLILDNAPGHPNLEHPNIKEIGGEGFDDFGEHDIEELLVDEALNDDDILESMVDTTKDFETVCVDSELEDVTPLDEKLLREGLQLSGLHPQNMNYIFGSLPPAIFVRCHYFIVNVRNLFSYLVREATLDRSNVYRWYKMFSEGREDVNDEERAGRPSTSTTDEKINEVEKMILANRRITVREVSEDLNISIGSCHSIFINDLGMRRVAAKFVPKLLNCDQKQHRMNIANEMFDSVRDDPNLLQKVITGDEAWVYGYDVETKAQSSQWKLPHEPRPKKARQVRSNVKVLLTVFFDCRGVVHHEFLPQGRTVNKEYYLQVMRNLREAIRQKRPDLCKNKNWLLHHDNAPAHTSLLVRDFLAKNNTLMMPQPPYSPDLAPCDFFLVP